MVDLDESDEEWTINNNGHTGYILTINLMIIMLLSNTVTAIINIIIVLSYYQHYDL